LALETVIRENVYGHSKRLKWIQSHTLKQDSIIEIGCGTGYMITFQLAKEGYNIRGYDVDEKSIEHGKVFFKEEGLNNEFLFAKDISTIQTKADVIIASEVLEHLPDAKLNTVLINIRKIVKQDGQLLITVPNGFGWFEMESFIWNKLGIGRFLEWFKITTFSYHIKKFFLGDKIKHPPHPATLSESPHVQRFTLAAIQNTLKASGFIISEVTGSVIFAGPFTNLIFHGVDSFLNFNCKLGTLFPSLASGFFITCKTSETQ